MATTFTQQDYQHKRNVVERLPTEEEKQQLQYPKDRFDLISVDKVFEWDQRRKDSPTKIRYNRAKTIWITVRCRRCGDVKQVADNPRMGCKQGPCHQKFVDWTGKRVHHLIPMEYVKVPFRKGQKPKWYWRCRCDCGGTTLATENQLLYGTKHACEKCSRKSGADKVRLPDGLSGLHRWWRELTRSAKLRGYSVGIDFDDVVELCKHGTCYYCGCAPQMTSYGVYMLGLDRRDNTRGYEKDNVVPCCGRCNVMKRNDTEEAFFSRIVQIARHRHLTFNDYPEKEYTEAGGNSEHQHKDLDSPLF